MSTVASTNSRSGWQRQQVKPATPANWDEQLDSLLLDLDTAKTTPKTSAVVPAATNQGTLFSNTTGLEGNEDFHERQEYVSPDQRTRTVEERSRRTAKSRDGQQLVSQQVYKSERNTSQQTAGLMPGMSTGPRELPQIELDGVDVPDLATLLPEANIPLAPGQSRIIKYDVRKTHQRSVSPQPVPVQKPTPPPIMPKPRARTPQLTQQPASPPADTYRSYTSVNEHKSKAAPPGQVVPPAGQPASNTTINYHIYNYGATGPDGLPLDGVPPPGSPENTNTIERHETHHHTASTQPGSPIYPPQGLSGAQPVALGPSSSGLHKYESRQYTTHHSDQPPTGNSRPHTHSYPAGPYSPPPGIPGAKTSTIERYETRHQSHSTSGRPPSPYENPAPIVTSPVEEYPTGGPWPSQPLPSDSYTTRYVTREVERTHASSPGGSATGTATFPMTPGECGPLVPRQPQDATYPDGPRRRELMTSSQAAVTSHDDVTQPMSPSKTQAGVYYPPEDANADHKWKTVEKSKNGNTKTKFEAEGSYKAKGGSKQKDDKGGKTIPICLPLCGGAACAVM